MASSGAATGLPLSYAERARKAQHIRSPIDHIRKHEPSITDNPEQPPSSSKTPATRLAAQALDIVAAHTASAKSPTINVWSQRMAAAVRNANDDPFVVRTNFQTAKPPPAIDAASWPEVGRPLHDSKDDAEHSPTAAPVTSPRKITNPSTSEKTKSKWVVIPPQELQEAADALKAANNSSCSHDRRKGSRTHSHSHSHSSSRRPPNNKANSTSTTNGSEINNHTASASGSTIPSAEHSLQASPLVPRGRRLPDDRDRRHSPQTTALQSEPQTPPRFSIATDPGLPMPLTGQYPQTHSASLPRSHSRSNPHSYTHTPSRPRSPPLVVQPHLAPPVQPIPLLPLPPRLPPPPRHGSGSGSGTDDDRPFEMRYGYGHTSRVGYTSPPGIGVGYTSSLTYGHDRAHVPPPQQLHGQPWYPPPPLHANANSNSNSSTNGNAWDMNVDTGVDRIQGLGLGTGTGSAEYPPYLPRQQQSSYLILQEAKNQNRKNRKQEQVPVPLTDTRYDAGEDANRSSNAGLSVAAIAMGTGPPPPPALSLPVAGYRPAAFGSDSSRENGSGYRAIRTVFGSIGAPDASPVPGVRDAEGSATELGTGGAVEETKLFQEFTIGIGQGEGYPHTRTRRALGTRSRRGTTGSMSGCGNVEEKGRNAVVDRTLDAEESGVRWSFGSVGSVSEEEQKQNEGGTPPQVLSPVSVSPGVHVSLRAVGEGEGEGESGEMGSGEARSVVAGYSEGRSVAVHAHSQSQSSPRALRRLLEELVLKEPPRYDQEDQEEENQPRPGMPQEEEDDNAAFKVKDFGFGFGSRGSSAGSPQVTLESQGLVTEGGVRGEYNYGVGYGVGYGGNQYGANAYVNGTGYGYRGSKREKEWDREGDGRPTRDRRGNSGFYNNPPNTGHNPNYPNYNPNPNLIHYSSHNPYAPAQGPIPGQGQDGPRHNRRGGRGGGRGGYSNMNSGTHRRSGSGGYRAPPLPPPFSITPPFEGYYPGPGIMGMGMGLGMTTGTNGMAYYDAGYALPMNTNMNVGMNANTAPKPLPAPVTHVSVPLDGTRWYLLGQVEYYLSAQNVVQDFYLRRRMDSQGWVPISLIASFKRVRQLTGEVDPVRVEQLVREVLMLSSVVEVRGDWVRMLGWREFVLPDAPKSRVPYDKEREDQHQHQPHDIAQLSEGHGEWRGGNNGNEPEGVDADAELDGDVDEDDEDDVVFVLTRE